MSQPLVYKGITVTGTGSPQNLLAALQAIDPTVQGFCRELNLQGDPGNSTNNLWIGDDALATGRRGVVLTAGISRNYREAGTSGVPIANIWFMASGGSPLLNVEILPG